MPKVTGLDGVIAAETDISLVDGEKGYLVYRGHWAKDLALNVDFEQVVYLLLRGQLPDASQLEAFKSELVSRREISAHVKAILDLLPVNMDMMSALRTAVSAMGADHYAWPPTEEQALNVIAVLPTVIAYRHHMLQGTAWHAPRKDLDHVANFLYMIHGVPPHASHIRALNAYFILTADHGLNASTFTGRTISSTQSDLVSAVTGAIGAMKGPLHGGAPSEVIEMLSEIGTKDNAEAWIRAKLSQGERLMGFGHRVYKTRDPRAMALREVTEKLTGEDPWFDFALHVENTAIKLLEEYKPGRRLYTNVEFYAAAVLRTVALPEQLFTATFTASRVAGWTAHLLEQVPVNRIFRPQSTYMGAMPE
jgi:citrate synthase